MEHHEKWCASNPDNWKACSGCVNLEETLVEVESGYMEDGVRDAKAFRCKVLNKLLYPIKVERRGLNKLYPETFKNQEPMPKLCSHRNDGFNFLTPTTK